MQQELTKVLRSLEPIGLPFVPSVLQIAGHCSEEHDGNFGGLVRLVDWFGSLCRIIESRLQVLGEELWVVQAMVNWLGELCSHCECSTICLQ